MKKNIFLILFLFSKMTFAGVSLNGAAIDSAVTFEAIGKPSLLKIKGHGLGATGKFQIEDQKVSGTAQFQLASLKTGIDLRDQHMKEKYLQVSDHPEAILTLTNVPLPNGFSIANPSKGPFEFSGILTLHGVEREIKGLYQIADGKFKSTADFEIKLSDFKIDIPTYLGVKVADIVKVHITFSKMDIEAHE